MRFRLPHTLTLLAALCLPYTTQAQSRSDSTVTPGAISIVQESAFNTGNINDPVQLIQGRVPGLAISRVGSDPNAPFTLRLRGLSSLHASTSPLVVIDGVIGGSLSSVDPADIASIEVRRDASAAALYGVRASAGVVLIQTKRGKVGKPRMHYQNYLAVEQSMRTLPVMSAEEFRTLRPDQNLGSETNWMDLVTRTALSHVHNLSFSGGVNNTTYRAALHYRGIQGLGLTSGFQQLNGRLNLTQTALKNRLRFHFDLALTERSAHFGFNEAFRYAHTHNPTAPVLLPASDPLFGRYGGYSQQELFDYYNPVAILEQNFSQGKFQTILGSFKAAYQLSDALSLSVSYASQQERELSGQYYSKQSFFRGSQRNGLANRFSEDRSMQLVEGSLQYEKSMGNNQLKLLGGYAYQSFFLENLRAEAGDFISDAITFNNIGSALDLARGQALIQSHAEGYQLAAFFTQASYHIDHTYHFNGSVRYEGSSRFGAENQWNPFFSVGGAVVLSNLLSGHTFDHLNVRASFGQVGNLPPASYLSQRLWGVSQPYFFNGEYVSNYGPVRNANPQLGPEIKREMNLGLDFAFLQNRLSGTLDYYRSHTRELLAEVIVPSPPNFASRTWGNLEDVALRNSGVELSIGYLFNHSEKSFSYEPRLLFATYNTVLDTLPLSADERANAQFLLFPAGNQLFDIGSSPGAPGFGGNSMSVLVAGEPIGQFYGYEFLRLDEAGNPVYADLDNSGQINFGDQQAFGNALPRYSIALSNQFRWGSFDAQLFLRGDFGHQIAHTYRLFYENPNFRPFENLVQTQYFDPQLSGFHEFSSYFVEKASFLVLDNLALGYTWSFPNRPAIQQIRGFIAAQNLFFLTAYSGTDPSPRYADAGHSSNGSVQPRVNNPNPLLPGIDRRNQYPLARGILLGVQCQF